MSKLTANQLHFMKLTRRDRGADGWTVVSKQVASFIQRPKPSHGRTILPPPDLAIYEPLPDGSARARLTAKGDALAEYLITEQAT